MLNLKIGKNGEISIPFQIVPGIDAATDRARCSGRLGPDNPRKERDSRIGPRRTNQIAHDQTPPSHLVPATQHAGNLDVRDMMQEKRTDHVIVGMARRSPIKNIGMNDCDIADLPDLLAGELCDLGGLINPGDRNAIRMEGSPAINGQGISTPPVPTSRK